MPDFITPVRFPPMVLLAVSAFLVSVGPGPLEAQSSDGLDVDGSPYYGTTELEAGFPDDPQTVPVRAGGTRSAEGLGHECVGSIGMRPDLRLHYEADEILPLNIYVMAEEGEELSLVVRRPDGSWVCNAGQGELDAALLMDDPMSGRYDIWVGGISAEYANGRLHISELPPQL